MHIQTKISNATLSKNIAI